MVQKWNNLEYDIILRLLKGAGHVREISRELQQPHPTVLRRLNQLRNEAIVDFKREGKNKSFFIKKTLQAKNYVFNAERYKLIKLLKKYPELSVIITDILNKSKQKMVILFGSYAKFAAKEQSDIDVYIESTKRSVKEEIESINSKISAKIGIFDTNSLLIKEIIKNHIILQGVENFYEKTKFFE